MPVELNLPKRREDHRLPSPAKPGVWSPVDELNDLADALAIEAATMELRDIKSVPHTWGHVILFENALYNPRHPGHEDAKGKWRALLTMVALREWPGFKVRTRDVDLSQVVGNDGRAGEAFVRLVRREKLESKIRAESTNEKNSSSAVAGATWDTIHLLYAKAKEEPEELLVGMLSPSTIVAPARDFAGDERLNQFWAKNGLHDPLTYGDKLIALSSDQLEVCRRFTSHLKDRLSRMALGANEAEHLAALLDSFAQDLQDKGARYHVEEWKGEDLGDLVNPSMGLYKAVNYGLKASGERSDVTDLRIGEIPFEDSVVKIVLADRRCADTLERKPEQVSLFGKHTLADLAEPNDGGPPLPIPEHLRREAAEKGILLLGPGDLLADRLTILGSFNAVEHPERFGDKLLPVKPAAFLLFDNLRKLGKSLILRGSESQPQVGLRVTVRSDRKEEMGSHEHIVWRLYGNAAAGAIENAYEPVALAAWPDFHIPPARGGDDRGGSEWKWNYLFAKSSGVTQSKGRSVRVTTGVSCAILRRDLLSAGRDDSSVADAYRKRLARWGSESGPWDREDREDRAWACGAEKDGGRRWFEWLRRMPDQEEKNRNEWILQRSDFAFEGALFRLPSTGGYVYAGLGILGRASEVRSLDPDAGEEAQISCDFGTSNTIVYCKQGNGSARPLFFEPRLRRFNQARDPKGSEEYTEFMPTKTVEQPFTTVMQHRNTGGGTNLGNEWDKWGKEPLWRDYAFFDPDVLSLTENLLGSPSPNLVFDLKWGTDPETRERMARYLHHVAILSLAEVLGGAGTVPRVKWHFSYPTSMPGLKDYRSVLASALGALGVLGNDVDFHTESHAALNYFKGVSLAQPRAILVLDIGGQSTDVALATRGEGGVRQEEYSLVWQDSFRLAGDDFMTQFLLYNRKFLEKLDIARLGRGGVFGDSEARKQFMSPQSDQQSSDRDRNVARAIINSAVFGAALDEKWSYVTGTDEMKRLKAGALVMMSGLCQFLGFQIEALCRNDEVKLAKNDLATIKLCFGGRGSTLFRKLAQTDEDSFARVTARLTNPEIDAVDAPRERVSVSYYFSQDMKHEAAKGMLAGKLTEEQQKSRGFDTDRAVGISARLNGKEVGATTFVKEVRETKRGEVESDVVEDEFFSFVESVGRQCGFKVDDDDVARATLAKDTIRTDGKKALLNILESKENSEAPFIVMLRKVIHLIYEGEFRIYWDAPGS